jgi:hypothetical protein
MNSITGTAGNDTITGTIADDEIFGGDGNDTITGAAGNDVIYGGKGTDTVTYTGAYSNFRLTALYEGKNNSFSGYTVADTIGSEGVDNVSSDVEYLTFSSGTVIYKVDNGTLSLVDTAAPTIAVTSSASSLSASQTATITFTLSESSSNFAASDVTVSGGTLSNFSGSGTTYTALFTPTANSTTSVVVRVASGVFSDAAGNVNADGSDSNNSVTMSVNTVQTDTTAPTIAITSSATSLSGTQTATLTFNLSESSSNFTASDITVSGGTLSNFNGSGASYTALFTPTANSTTNGVVRVASGVFSDAAGNLNADGADSNNTVTMAVNTVPSDTVAPTIAVSSNTASLSGSQTATITLTLSESSSNFAASDVTVSGGTLSNFSGSDTSYTALFTPTANSTTNGMVRVASGVFSDAAGNLNVDGSDSNNTVTMAVNTVQADTTAPTITITSSSTSLSGSQTATITFTLSESSSNFAASDVTVSGGTLSYFTGSGTSYTALFTPTTNSTTSGVVRVASGVLSDAAGNLNADGADSNNTVTISVNTAPVDNTAPTIAVSSDKSSLAAGGSAALTFVVSEATSNFTVSDLLVFGGSVSNFTGSGSTYTALFTIASNSSINGSVSVLSGMFSDLAGNLNADGSDTNNTVYFARASTVSNETHNLSVIVDKNVLGASATLLKDLTEYITYTNGAITKHTVEYAGLSFDYDQIDALITTVTRDGEFTSEFNKEINDYLGTELNIAYATAVKLVGAASIDAVVLTVAGADGNYVG